jgi:predicted ABC-type transport system involved in lysophospholipase L1 biosynthesis ATPase subunit
LLMDLSQRHATAFLIVTHDPELAARMHRVLRLGEGGLEGNSEGSSEGS